MLNLLIEETPPSPVNNAGGAYVTETAALTDGGYVVAWIHVEEGPGDPEYSVRVQRFSSGGAEVGGEIVATTSTMFVPNTVAVAALSNGTFVVSWELPNEGAPNQSADIQARIYEADGTPVGSQFIANTSTAEEETTPQAIALDGGGFVLAWRAQVFPGTEGDTIRAQIFDSTGTKVGGEIIVTGADGGFQFPHSAVALSGGDFVVTWADQTPGSYELHGQRFDASGTPQGASFTIASSFAGRMDIGATLSGGFVVAWKDQNSELKYQFYTSGGQKTGNELAATEPNHFADQVSLAVLPSGVVVIAWADASEANPSGAFRAQLFDPNFGYKVGDPLALDPLADLSTLSVSALADGQVTVAYHREGSIFQQLLDPPIFGTDGADTFAGGTGADRYAALGGNDLLDGGLGNDTLDGGFGNDTMTGGLGDDTYYMDSLGDTVIELAGEGTDTLAVGFSYALAAGSAIENLATIAAAATTTINLTGNAGTNTLTGNNGANVLNGGAGADTLNGLGGNDLFFVDNIGDVIVEAAGGGSDRVFASVSYVLSAGAHVEILSTTSNAGTGAINFTGNELVNSIAGNNGNNVLNGGAGADMLNGLGGNDWFFVDNAGDVVVEAAGGGTDRIFASVSYTMGAGVHVETLSTTNNAGTDAINLTGNELVNSIAGNNGNNILNGGAGADSLNGLGGNDWFFVDNVGDAVIEYAGGGSDRIFASVSYTMGAGVHVETLSTTNNAGTDAINLTGNELVNSIAGNNGNNVLNGGTGADTLNGLGGDDWFFVDQFGDVVVEGAGGGTDRIFASSSYAMGAGVHVETLSTTNNAGTNAINFAGNELANSIAGNNGANVLDGGGGSDTLNGLGGADTFRFTTALGAGNVDTITGYVVADDTIQLDNAVFTGLAAGALAAGAFNTGAAATQADDRIIYNAATGALLFDADGNGAGAAVQFGTLAGGLALTAADFIVI